jgi:hypothetical protein
MNNNPSWQSTVIAVAFIGLVGAIFLTVYSRDGIDAALKAWGAVGTIIGVLTGAIPTYFFGKAANETLRERGNELKEKADEAERKIEAIYMTNSDIAKQVRERYPHLFESPEGAQDDETSG